MFGLLNNWLNETIVLAGNETIFLLSSIKNPIGTITSIHASSCMITITKKVWGLTNRWDAYEGTN